MRRTHLATISAILLAAAAFGVGEGVLWSRGGTTSFWLGNVSSTYLLLAFLAGWVVAARHPGVWLAPLMGLAATLVALAAFYTWPRHAMDISSSSATAGLHRYGLGGLLTGPLFGALGALWSRRRTWLAAAVVGLAFIIEPVAWRAHYGFQLIPADVRHVEVITGTGILILSALISSRRAATRS